MTILPLGKLPPDLLVEFLNHFSPNDPAVILGPGIGLDCAVLEMDESYLVFKSEPITFVADNIGWYAVQIAANDIATTGAVPRWMLVTLLLPENKTTSDLINQIAQQLSTACSSYEISLIGGHTEITTGLDRPIINTTMIGVVAKSDLIVPSGAKAGDELLLTQSIPIEGTAIIAQQFDQKLSEILSPVELEEARKYLYSPGISVYQAAQIAQQAGKIHAMHDPTEGGLAAALHEMANASQKTIIINPQEIPITSLSMRICQFFKINPYATIASGALLLAVSPNDSETIISELRGRGIPCARIGHFLKGVPQVLQLSGDGLVPMALPVRDEIARLFEID